MYIKKIFSLLKLENNPKLIFLLDSIGAVVTASLLGLLLAPLHSSFGIPQKIIYLLSAVAALYAVYSLCCYYFLGKLWQPYLIAITVGNLLYAITTLILMIYFRDSLTVLGLFYFTGEIMIIVALVILEKKLIYLKK
jgi:hypothetical protein